MKWKKIPNLEHQSEAGAYRDGHWILWFGPRNRLYYDATFRIQEWIALYRTNAFVGEPDKPTIYVQSLPKMSLKKMQLVVCTLTNEVADAADLE